MKTIINFFVLLCLSGIIVSCDDDESVTNLIPESEQLVSIEEVFILNNDPVGVTYTYTLNNGLNTQITSDIGTSQVQVFEDGKMVSIEYYNNDVLIGTETYDYDMNDRIINNTRDFSDDNQDSNRAYEYIGNEIFYTRTTYNTDGSIANEDDFVYTLNGLNQMVNCRSLDNDVSWEATYSNGNLATFTYFDGTEVIGSANFTYTDELASEPYQKERYRFGSEWRNNIMLGQTGEYAFKQLAELGENFLASYTYTRSSDSSMTITLSASYEFDEQGRLIKQNKNKMFFMAPHDRVFTYHYE